MKQFPQTRCSNEKVINQCFKTLTTKNSKKIYKKTGYKSSIKEKFKEDNRFNIAIPSKHNIVSPVLLFTVFGFIFFAQAAILIHPDVNEWKNVATQIYGTENLENVLSKLSSLSRVINAIVLHNSFRGELLSMQNVMIEALDIQDIHLLNTIEESGVSEVIHTINTIDSLATRSFSTIHGTEVKWNEIKLNYNTSQLNVPMSQILFSINISKFNVSYLPVEIDQLDKNRKLLVQELNLTKPDSRKALYFAKEFVRTVSSINVIIPTFVLDQETNKFIDSLEEAASFLPKIELYQQLTDKKQLKLFTESLDSVLASLSVIKSLEDSTQKQIITSHLDIIENLLSKTVKVSDKQALIGFPRGSLDVQLLFKDLDDEWLKKVLNNGNTLRELKCILNPIRIFQAQILMENKWKKYDRNVSSTLIRRSRIKFESIVASKPISISNAIENAKNTLRALRPLDYLKNSELDKFKQLLISSSIFTNLSKELIELKNCSHSVQDVFHSTMNIAFSKTVPMKNDPDKLVAYLKENFMNNQYASFVHQFSTKFRFLEKQRKQIVKVLSQTINIKSTLTDQIFINIRHLCTQLNSDLKTVQNYVKLLNSLSPLTNIERVATEELPSMLSSARNVMDKWRELWEDNKTKNKTTQSFHRLAYFPFARETSFQLACSQRALMLYQKHDLRQKLQNFASNGCALAKKIESVPQVKKQFNDSDWRHFLSINKSITILLSGVEKLSRRLTTGDQSLKSFGNTLSVLDHINVSTFNFSLMIRILEKLKTMSIGQSREVSDFENILKQLEGLQFAAMRRKNSHIILLAHTGNFFQSFFSKQSKSDWQPFLIFVVICAVAIASILLSILLGIMTIRARRTMNQGNANEFKIKEKKNAHFK